MRGVFRFSAVSLEKDAAMLKPISLSIGQAEMKSSIKPFQL